MHQVYRGSGYVVDVHEAETPVLEAAGEQNAGDRGIAQLLAERGVLAGPEDRDGADDDGRWTASGGGLEYRRFPHPLRVAVRLHGSRPDLLGDRPVRAGEQSVDRRAAAVQGFLHAAGGGALPNIARARHVGAVDLRPRPAGIDERGEVIDRVHALQCPQERIAVEDIERHRFDSRGVREGGSAAAVNSRADMDVAPV